MKLKFALLAVTAALWCANAASAQSFKVRATQDFDPSSTVPSHKWFVFTGLKFSEWPSDTPVLIRRQVEGWANRSVEWVATRPRRPETLSPPRRAFGHETRIPCR